MTWKKGGYGDLGIKEFRNLGIRGLGD